MSIKTILKGSYNVLFSQPPSSTLGFLANLGIVTLVYFILYLFLNIFSFEKISFLTKLNIFSITYLVLLGIIYKAAIGKNEYFNAGFLLSAIFIVLIILATYIRNIL